MAVIRRKRKQPPKRVERNVGAIWWQELMGYFPEGSAWNELSNEWVNQQYLSGASPKQVFDQLTFIEM